MVLMKKPSVSESPSGRAPERAPDGILRRQKLAAAEKYFRGSLPWFQIFREFIGATPRAEGAQGAHRPVGRGLPPGRRVGACGPPEDPLPWLSSFPIFFRYRKNLFGDFLPFGLRFKISSERGQKHGKNRNWHLALS